MRFLRPLTIAVCAGLLAGCAKPAVKQPSDKTGAGTPVVTPGAGVTPPAVTPPGVKPPAVKPPDGGRATPQQVKDAGAGKDIPPAVVPPDAKFVPPSAKGPEEALIFKKLRFDYDRYTLTPEAQEVLRGIAAYLLNKNTTVKVMIEGHCDDRGTREYNLVLGEQRALSARRYLVSLGVSPDRLFTVSYGEDKPEDPAANDEAWAKNRRCEFLLSAD